MVPEAKTVWAGLEFRKAMLLRNVEPLTEEHMHWKPAPDRVSIAWQLWHIVEVEDNWIRDLILREPLDFPFGRQVREAKGSGDFPPKAELIRYLQRIREQTRQRLEAMTTEDFDREVEDADYGTITVRDVWMGVVTSFAWHAGQVALTAKLIPDSPVETMPFGYWKTSSWSKGKNTDESK